MALGAGNKKSQPVRTSVAGSPVPPVAARPSDVKPSAVEFKQVVPVKSAGAVKASIEDIRKRAYEIYLKRRTTGAPGGAESDWIQAERELSIRA